MKTLLPFLLVVVATLTTNAATYHRSFRNGYPAGAQGVTVRQQPNAAVLKAPKTVRPKSTVVTNRVVLTKEQAEALMKKDAKRFKKVEPVTTSTK